MQTNILSEASRVGYIVITVAATDADSGFNGVVVYRIVSGNIAGLFVFHPYYYNNLLTSFIEICTVYFLVSLDK